MNVSRQMARMFLSKGSQTMRMTNELMGLFGMRKRRNNGSLLTTVLGAGALFYGMKKVMENKEGQKQKGHEIYKKSQNQSSQNPEKGSLGNRKPEQNSAIRNIINTYGKNDPGLSAVLQELSTDLGETKNKANVTSNRANTKKDESHDWEI